LDVTGGAIGDGTPIVQWYNNQGNTPYHRQFEFRPVAGKANTYVIVAKHSGKTLQASSLEAGAPIVQWVYREGRTSQQWERTPIAGIAGTDDYTFRNVMSNLYLDVAGASPAAGARLVQWYWTGASNQAFYLVSVLPGSQ
jgi:hypothetical protein